MWSRITDIKKKLQAEAVVHSLKGHALNIKEKIQAEIGDKLKGNEQGIDELIKFLDNINLKDEKVEKQKIPRVFPVKVQEQEVPGVDAEKENRNYKEKKTPLGKDGKDRNNEGLAIWDIIENTIKNRLRP